VLRPGGSVVTWSVASERMSDTELSWFVDLIVTRALSAVPGVGRVTRVGGVDREGILPHPLDVDRPPPQRPEEVQEPRERAAVGEDGVLLARELLAETA